jgi:hypothetical protein
LKSASDTSPPPSRGRLKAGALPPAAIFALMFGPIAPSFRRFRAVNLALAQGLEVAEHEDFVRNPCGANGFGNRFGWPAGHETEGPVAAGPVKNRRTRGRPIGHDGQE